MVARGGGGVSSGVVGNGLAGRGVLGNGCPMVGLMYRRERVLFNSKLMN